MQQVTDLRRRWNPRGQWVQLGILSASVLTPLLSRWNELRAAERAHAMREQAEQRLKSARGMLPRTRHIERSSSSRRSSSMLWLVGAGVGLAAAGAAAYILVQRQFDIDANEPLVILPAPSPNGHSKRQTTDALTSERRSATAPAADTAVGALAEQATATAAPSAPVAVPEAEPTTAGVEDVAAEAKFIGNVRTMIYHEAGADNLPAEENRVYFASEDEARDAGYRRDRDETPSEPESQAHANE